MNMLKFNMTIFQHFKGFDLNLFDDSMDQSHYYFFSALAYSSLDFYLGEKKMNSCQDFINATANYSNDPIPIFQFFSKINTFRLEIILDESQNRLCPLAFKNVFLINLELHGENSFYSKRLISFSNETFQNLNSIIFHLIIYIPNVEIDKNLIHSNVFKNLEVVKFHGKIKKIHNDVFHQMKMIREFHFQNIYLRHIMHTSGIDWLKSLNRDVNVDTEKDIDFNRLKYNGIIIKVVVIECIVSISPPLIDLFPDEDFCLYKDFPINQLVTIVEDCFLTKTQSAIMKNKIPCTYLWITRSYKRLFKLFGKGMIDLLNSSDYESRSKCNFEQRIKLCNKSDFNPKHIVTYFELEQAIFMIETVINILSYFLSIFGIITNLLIIITISSKKNKEDFKENKQYDI